MIKLESGKYYRTRNGDVVGPVKVGGGYYIGENHYYSDGRKSLNKYRPDDLIEEVPNPNEQPMPSDYHLQRAIDVMGMGLSVYSVKKYTDKYWCIVSVAGYIAQHEPEPVDLVLNEARRRVEEYFGHPVGNLDSGDFDDSNFMKLVIDALRFNIADLGKPNTE